MKNVTLNSVFKKSSKWIVNQDGFNFLDSLEDKNGRSYFLALMSDRVDKTEAMLASLGENDYMFVAETNNNGEKDVIGFAG
ncbi:hypothetical protein ACTPEM_25415, partial [Clostridioides difficile]